MNYQKANQSKKSNLTFQAVSSEKNNPAYKLMKDELKSKSKQKATKTFKYFFYLLFPCQKPRPEAN